MPTVRLIPSTYYLSNSSYLSVSNESNMYNNTDNTTYATVTNSRTSTSSYYIYVRGFNFDDIPSVAIVSDFTIKLKGNYSGGYSQNMYLYDGTSTSMGSASSLSSTVSTYEFTCSSTWEQVVAAGSDFGIRINCRRSSRNTTSYIYIYGAEIEVTYTIPVSATVTSSLTGDGTISPLGVTNTYEGEEYELTIVPTNKLDPVTVTKDGVDVTANLVAHGAETSMTAVPTSYTTDGIQSGSQYAEYCIGYSAENPSSSGTSSNMYASSSSTGYAEYSFDFSDVPSNALIEELYVDVYGHRESSTIDSTHVSSVTIYNGSTAISEDVDFESTDNETIRVTATDSITRSDLDNVTIRHTVGYYGGLILGATFHVGYSTGGGLDHYTYTITVTGNTVIAVVIGGNTAKIYLKVNGTWTEYSKVYVKTNGAWVEQSDLTSIFDTNTNYVKG